MKDEIKEINIKIPGQILDYVDTKEHLLELYYYITNLQERIDKANQLLENILVVGDWEHEGRYRPVKNTTSQDVYKTIIMLNELLETPYRINYGLLQGKDKGE